MCQYLAKNNSQPEYGETPEEILTRALLHLMEAADLDETKPVVDDPHYNFNIARHAATSNKEINHRTAIRKVFYAPNFCFALGSMAQLGPIYIESRFFKIPRLAEMQGVHAGVSLHASHFYWRVSVA